MSVTSLPSRRSPEANAASMTGASEVVSTLVARGVKHLFGYPGAAVIPFFDALIGSPLELIRTIHEQGAIHMADAYARRSGKCAVCVATSGPGATNLVTGIATAYADSVPVLAITGQVRRDLIGSDAFQEADIVGMVRSVTKWAVLVRDASSLRATIEEAMDLAMRGRRGPVLVDIPVDVFLAREVQKERPRASRSAAVPSSPRQVAQAAGVIAAAQRPVIIAGHGVVQSGAAAEMVELARKTHSPVVSTLLGLGAMDVTDPLFLGMLGMHGSTRANRAVQQSDCLVVLGARLGDRVTVSPRSFAPTASVIHVDIDPTTLGKTVQPEIPIVGDILGVLRELNPAVPQASRPAWWLPAQSIAEAPSPTIRTADVLSTIARLTDRQAVLVTGVGQHQMRTAQVFPFRHPRQLITSGGLGTMGFGCPGAIGAQLADPEAIVFDIDGDGSFAMTMHEMATAARYAVPVKFIVMDNSTLGMVRQWQELFWDRRYSGVSQHRVDFTLVARGLGVAGEAVDRPEDLSAAISRAIAHAGPYLVHVRTDPEENVFPMVRPGSAIHDQRTS